MRSQERMAQYLRKKASELVGGGKKSYQIPINAPPRFRRLRASCKLLPPIHHNPDWTGELHLYTKEGEVLDLSPR